MTERLEWIEHLGRRDGKGRWKCPVDGDVKIKAIRIDGREVIASDDGLPPARILRWGVIEAYVLAAPVDRSGEAGETRQGLDPKGESAVPEGQAPK